MAPPAFVDHVPGTRGIIWHTGRMEARLHPDTRWTTWARIGEYNMQHAMRKEGGIIATKLTKYCQHYSRGDCKFGNIC